MLWGNRVWWQNIMGLWCPGLGSRLSGQLWRKARGPTHKSAGPMVATLKRYTVELPSPCPLTPYCGSSWGHPAATLTASCCTGRFSCLPLSPMMRQALEAAGRWIQQQQQLPRQPFPNPWNHNPEGVKVFLVCFMCMDVSVISDVSVVLLQTRSWGRIGSGSIECTNESMFCFGRSPLCMQASAATIGCFDGWGSEFSEFSGHWIQFNRDSNVLGGLNDIKVVLYCSAFLKSWLCN